jgi:hypothetical protein
MLHTFKQFGIKFEDIFLSFSNGKARRDIIVNLEKEKERKFRSWAILPRSGGAL